MLWAEGSNVRTESFPDELYSLSFAVFGSLHLVCWIFFDCTSSPACGRLWARIHSACLACYFVFSLSSVFFPISNYLLVSEVQPRIFHGISPTSSSPFGHCWVFRGESRLWHVHYVDLEQYTGKAIQLPVPWHHFFLAFWLEGLAEEEVWFDA